MTPGELTPRVPLDTCAAVAALAAVAAWLGGAPAGLGVLAGGALAVVNFRWLVVRASAATAAGNAAASAWLVRAGPRVAPRSVGLPPPPPTRPAPSGSPPGGVHLLS